MLNVPGPSVSICLCLITGPPSSARRNLERNRLPQCHLQVALIISSLTKRAVSIHRHGGDHCPPILAEAEGAYSMVQRCFMAGYTGQIVDHLSDDGISADHR